MNDVDYLALTLDLASIRRGFCSPNPSVGAAVVDAGGHVIATGYHEVAGQPHAEIEALAKLGFSAQGATIYISLEPCCHFGKTPPCTEALIQAGVRRVVYGFEDPNPLVSGKSADYLRMAGIQCDYVEHLPIQNFYQSYAHWVITNKPYVTAKIAMSLDGKIASQSGAPIAITGEALQAFTHQQRLRSDALLTSIRTILCDNPQLNVRVDNDRVPKPIYLLDSVARLPLTATIFETAQSITLFHAERAPTERLQALSEQGVTCVAVREKAAGLALEDVISFIGAQGAHDLWVEMGGEGFSAILNARLAQRAYIYVAPTWISEGLPAFKAKPLLHARKYTWQQYGDDVLCELMF